MPGPYCVALLRCDLALDGIAAGGKDAGRGRDLDADGNRLLAHCQVQALAVDLRHNAVGVQLFDLIRRAVERDAATFSLVEPISEVSKSSVTLVTPSSETMPAGSSISRW